MMDGVTNLRDMDLILNISAGYPGLKEWIQFGGDPSGVAIAGGVTAVSAPLLYPYYPAQMFGIMVRGSSFGEPDGTEHAVGLLEGNGHMILRVELADSKEFVDLLFAPPSKPTPTAASP